MKIYLVGGAVRDKLLGLPVKERDWVVVGASVNDMLNKGFRQVGKEFPVFLHPKTHEEYALARLERKTGKGYKGFSFDSSPDVCLEDDLIRRDLTINAMAEDENGEVIDPFGGKEDLDKRVLRHVSTAFAEDPVRILRIGRFLARYAHLGFSIAPDTLKLMQEMVKAGEVNALVAERVWKELHRALAEPHPEKFFEALDACNALEILFPAIKLDDKGMRTLIQAGPQDSLIRFTLLLHHQDAEQIKQLSSRYRVPNDYKQLALLVEKHYQQALSFSSFSAEELIALLSSLDCFRREKRFQLFLQCCQLIADATSTAFNKEQLEAYTSAAKSVDIKSLTEQGLSGIALAKKIKEKRIEKIKSVTL